MSDIFARNIDVRAVSAGTMAGALSMTAAIYALYGGMQSQFTLVGIVLASFILVAVPAGALTGVLTRTPREQTREGGLAGIFGTGVGILLVGFVSSVTATQLPIAHRFDLLFIAAAYGLFALAFIVPVTFLVGGWTAKYTARAVQNLHRTEDDWGEVGRFRD